MKGYIRGGLVAFGFATACGAVFLAIGFLVLTGGNSAQAQEQPPVVNMDAKVNADSYGWTGIDFVLDFDKCAHTNNTLKSAPVCTPVYISPMSLNWHGAGKSQRVCSVWPEAPWRANQTALFSVEIRRQEPPPGTPLEALVYYVVNPRTVDPEYIQYTPNLLDTKNIVWFMRLQAESDEVKPETESENK